MQRIEAAAGQGDSSAQLALDAYAYRIRKYIGAYAAAMGGCDAVAFTGGVGEHSARVRAQATENLEFLGLRLDPAANAAPAFGADGVALVQDSRSRGRLLVVQAREEWTMAREARRLLAEHAGAGPLAS